MIQLSSPLEFMRAFNQLDMSTGRFSYNPKDDSIVPLRSAKVEATKTYVGQFAGEYIGYFSDACTRWYEGSSHLQITHRLQRLAAEIVLAVSIDQEAAAAKFREVYEVAFRTAFNELDSQKGLLDWKTTAKFGGESEGNVKRRIAREQEATERAEEIANAKVKPIQDERLLEIHSALLKTIQGTKQMKAYYQSIRGKEEAVAHFQVAIECLEHILPQTLIRTANGTPFRQNTNR